MSDNNDKMSNRVLNSMRSFDDMFISDNEVYRNDLQNPFTRRNTLSDSDSESEDDTEEEIIKIASRDDQQEVNVKEIESLPQDEQEEKMKLDESNMLNSISKECFPFLKDFDDDEHSSIILKSASDEPSSSHSKEFNVESNIMKRRQGVSPPSIVPVNSRINSKDGTFNNSVTPFTPCRSFNDAVSTKSKWKETNVNTNDQLATEPTAALSPVQNDQKKSKRRVQRRPSQDDTCIVKTTRSTLVKRMFNIRKPLNDIKNSFPTFNVFKNNVQNKKSRLLQKHMIDSELLYELLENLHWSLSFQPDQRKELAMKLLSGEKSSFDRAALQQMLRDQCNVSIGNYEADNLLQYAALYLNQDTDTVQPFNGTEELYSPYFNEKADLPFNLLLPHHISKKKWCNALDRFAIRQLREASNLEAANMTSVRMGSDYSRQNVHQGVKIPSLPSNITKQDIKEFREDVKKYRPERKNGIAVEISVYRKPKDSQVLPLNE